MTERNEYFSRQEDETNPDDIVENPSRRKFLKQTSQIGIGGAITLAAGGGLVGGYLYGRHEQQNADQLDIQRSQEQLTHIYQDGETIPHPLAPHVDGWKVIIDNEHWQRYLDHKERQIDTIQYQNPYRDSTRNIAGRRGDQGQFLVNENQTYFPSREVTNPDTILIAYPTTDSNICNLYIDEYVDGKHTPRTFEIQLNDESYPTQQNDQEPLSDRIFVEGQLPPDILRSIDDTAKDFDSLTIIPPTIYVTKPLLNYTRQPARPVPIGIQTNIDITEDVFLKPIMSDEGNMCLYSSLVEISYMNHLKEITLYPAFGKKLEEFGKSFDAVNKKVSRDIPPNSDVYTPLAENQVIHPLIQVFNPYSYESNNRKVPAITADNNPTSDLYFPQFIDQYFAGAITTFNFNEVNSIRERFTQLSAEDEKLARDAASKALDLLESLQESFDQNAAARVLPSINLYRSLLKEPDTTSALTQ